MNESARLYSIIFIWIRDAPLFQSYLEQLGPIGRRYGGGLDLALLPEAVYGAGIEKPDLINVVYFATDANAEAFDADPEFLAIRPLRDRSIEMLGVQAKLVGGLPGIDPSRRFTLEIAYLADREKFERCLAQQEPLLSDHGFRTERSFRALDSFGVHGRPDLLTIGSYPQEGFDSMHTDPRHADVERSYATAVAKSIFVVGKVGP
jgi:hypothetical protein